MDEGIKKDIWSVMEDFSKAPGDKDFSKMKTQYTMFVFRKNNVPPKKKSPVRKAQGWAVLLHC